MLEKKYDHLSVENGKYDYWLKNNYFKSGDLTKEPFCIVIPPPNVTGKLHLGHAWDTTLQDIVIRYKRMQGYDALWLPGMDHAGVATQAKIDERLRNQGINPREMDREEWMKVAWSWKEEYASIIRSQWAKLGHSMDYSKERFTFDEGLSKAVNKVFIDLYNKGLIYKGTKPINWDPIAKTALSNIEVIYKKEHGKMYYLKYMFPNSNDYIEIATTRTETLASDTAVVVNPNDERYKHLIGKTVITPLRKEEVPIITDEYIDMSFGTGAMKCSAHAVEDFEILKKNNLEVRESINPDGLLNSNALEFEGMTREVARAAIAEKLQKEGLITKIEDYDNEVGHSERTDAVVEIMVMPQWFVKMKPLADEVLRIQNIKDEKVNFIPKRFEKILINWMSNIQDWCISRQVWWGHRIPAWYKNNEMKVSVTSPGEGWVQDEDVLDTWFSSALWPFSTLNWPDKLDTRYFPNNLLVTGYDIIFFWVSRMMFTSLEFNKKRPFNEVLIHGLIRDKQGRKMSKSLGNGVDPMDVIEQYGADSLRFFLTTNTASGMDLRFDEEKIKSTWNFINKIWNASRYVLMVFEDTKDSNNLSDIDKWILTKLNNTIKVVTKNMNKYEFQNVGTELYNFIWNDFCDWYIEFSKVNPNKTVLKQVLISILKMLHPFMPFVTEEIYSNFDNESIMISKYPEYDSKQIFNNSYRMVEELKEFIVNVRNIKAENNITKDSKQDFICKSEGINDILRKLLKISDDNNIDNISDYKCIVIETKDNSLIGKVTLKYYIEEVKENKEELLKEKEILENNISRRKNLLSNEGYINKAPSHLVEEEKNKLNEEKIRLLDLINRINKI